MQPAEIIALQDSTTPVAPVARNKVSNDEMPARPDADGFKEDFVFSIDWRVFPKPDGYGEDIIKIAYFVYCNHRCSATAPTGAIPSTIEVADAGV
jgi:hypothetical protein